LAGPSVPDVPTETTSLLQPVLDLREHAHEGPCNHGTFSPRPASPTSILSGPLDDQLSATDSETESQLPIVDGVIRSPSGSKHWRRRLTSRMKSKKISQANALAERHGVKNTTWMYVPLVPLTGLERTIYQLIMILGISRITCQCWFGPENINGHT
jgi:hypothetical protein